MLTGYPDIDLRNPETTDRERTTSEERAEERYVKLTTEESPKPQLTKEVIPSRRQIDPEMNILPGKISVVSSFDIPFTTSMRRKIDCDNLLVHLVFFLEIIESLSTDVLEPRTATGRLTFKVLPNFYLQK